MAVFVLEYRFNGEPRSYELELKQVQLAEHEAAMHLLQLHLGDAENSLLMPSADSTPEQVMEQAERVGLTDIQVGDRKG
ncbi:hypothetical protein SAMN05216496_2884 [Pseudomonas sp. Z003-0.4C(8344-21)]|uniref:hypothetical protein n=1 Tax=Pseudomonas sp. Z003-0.4C(8344-21) TaxID=1855380 RepID=UPI00087CC2CD|nr:hypothetical protein [Pseudomonas sp. Z003-0.4C(8344-21)]SDS95929.1 hypothetical protein SAMN05216496_2884 [Pseudomonas sp. Z003-0.4C(8344-21)]